MKIILVLSAVVAAALAAPAKDGPSFVYGVRRSKKSAYGPSYGAAPSYGVGSSFGAPCAHGSVGVNYAASAPIPLYLAPQGGAHYREDEKEAEGENSESSSLAARSSYGGGFGGGAGAVGVFPNARLGGCAVPLLLSCAPNVVSGHIVKQQHGSYVAPASYKETDEKDAHEHSWAHAQRASDNHDDFKTTLHHNQKHEQMQKKQ